jgi:ABC-2 type transport system ATP-binding protein
VVVARADQSVEGRIGPRAGRATGDHEGAVVAATGVTKWYGDATALERVDLEVGPGVVHGLLGPNGAGKTTLLSVVFGLVLPDEGELRLFGRTRAEGGARWLDGVGGFVETPAFYPYLSGFRNLSILAGLDGDGGPRLVREVLDQVGLGEVGKLKVRGYSLGMRQRLGLASALLRRPRLLILDEPTNGMDPAGIRDLRAALRTLADGGLTVLLSSHDMVQVDEICDSVTVLARGEVVFDGRLDAMRAHAPAPTWRLQTSDDVAALSAAPTGAVISTPTDGVGLVVVAPEATMDRYAIDLGRAGVAVRGLGLETTPLESLFFRLTEGRGAAEGGDDDRVRPV